MVKKKTVASVKSADTRSVSTDALATLGTIIDDKAERDAIHLAVIPCTAKVTVYPGQHVNKDGLPSGEPVGIVDPFLTGPAYPAQMFWLVIYPRVITSLRHVWSHPAFADEPVRQPQEEAFAMPALDMTISKATSAVTKTSVSEDYIAQLASRVGISYDDLVEAAKDYLLHRSWLTGGAEMEGESVPDEFWDHFEVVCGTRVVGEDRGSFFSCSC